MIRAMETTQGNTIVGIALIIVLGSVIAYIFLRYPDFRRAFIAHWSPSAVARRMDQWAEDHREPRTEEEALRRIRRHLAALGAPVDHLSDEELRDSIERFGASMRHAGLSARDVATNLTRLGRAGVTSREAMRSLAAQHAAASDAPAPGSPAASHGKGRP